MTEQPPVTRGLRVEPRLIGSYVRDAEGYLWRREADMAYDDEPTVARGAWRLTGGIRGSERCYPWDTLLGWAPLRAVPSTGDLSQPEEQSA